MFKCPACKKLSVKKAIKSIIKTSYDNQVLKLLDKLCSACQLSAVAKLGNHPSDCKINELYSIVNGLLTSSEIRTIREQLNLKQKDAARLCGGGVNAFSRYELGKSVPVRATSNLLRLLSRHPDEIEYLMDFCPDEQ